LLAAQFADRMHCTAAAGAVAMFDVDQHFIARQVRRKRPVVAIGPCLAPLALFVLCGVLRGLVRGGGLLLFGRGDHLAQHLLQRCGIVRQGGEVDLHDSIMINAVESAPMTPV
jgi:hypothetical protein